MASGDWNLNGKLDQQPYGKSFIHVNPKTTLHDYRDWDNLVIKTGRNGAIATTISKYFRDEMNLAYLRSTHTDISYSITAYSTGATELHIEGPPDEILRGRLESLGVNDDGTLEFTLADHRIVVSGWPPALAKHCPGPQYITVITMMDPAGPIAVFEARRSPEDEQPWLRLVSNGPLDSEIAPGFSLERAENGAVTIRGQQPGLMTKPIDIQDSSGRSWQFQLLRSKVPRFAAGYSREGEPRGDWYLIHPEGCRSF
jgi:hypothetical protein